MDDWESFPTHLMFWCCAWIEFAFSQKCFFTYLKAWAETGNNWLGLTLPKVEWECFSYGKLTMFESQKLTSNKYRTYGAHLRSSICHSLPPLPQLSVKQGFHTIPTTVSTQSFELLQVLPLFHGQSFRPCQQTATCRQHKQIQISTDDYRTLQ